MAKRNATSPLRTALQRGTLALLGCLVLAYPADWAIWRLRMLTGHGMGTAEISQTTAATLKGNRFEVYPEERTTVDCSHSLLPEAGAGACWWLQRHASVVTQY